MYILLSEPAKSESQHQSDAGQFIVILVIEILVPSVVTLQYRYR
jgi:hypothetical protein